jgi:cyclopropane-fatty-acyl-phospholipid synthase
METVLSAEKKGSIWNSIVLNLFEKMDLGRLDLVMPSGEILHFGNGRGTHAAIRINNYNFFKKCVLYGDIGFGEAYVDGDWDTENLKNVISWFLLNIENAPSISGSKRKLWMVNLLKMGNKVAHFFRANTVEGSRKNISEHYDLNNKFFELFLDESMTYSSGLFNFTENERTLAESQHEKYDRLSRQLRLKADDHVLEIGSGWGGNAIHMAKNYGCKVTTVTISEEQYKYAKALISLEGLEDKIDIRLMDYRNIEGKFDKIVSIEMLEAVGHNFLQGYFQKCQDLLKKDGILALQVITCPESRYDQLRSDVDWIQKYIFPGSLLPSISAITNAVNKTGSLTMVDLKEMGLHYAKTLHMWRDEFNSKLTEVRKLGFDNTFIRKWNYYLSYCEAAFAMRNINVMQFTFTRPNNTNL